MGEAVGRANDGFEPLAGGAAARVGKELGAIKTLRLLEVVGRHLHLAGLEAGLKSKTCRCVREEIEMKSFGDALASEVVFSGAEAAGEDEDVRATERIMDSFDEVAGIVSDDSLEADLDTEIVEAGGEEEGVRVLAMRCKHLGTDGDDFSNHSLGRMIALWGA